jgi:hypothetical protein
MNKQTKYPRSGIYEHYKSTPGDRRYYQVLGTAKNTETKEKFVIYIPLYVLPEHKGLKLQARPLDMFLETVEWKGKTLSRFNYIGDEMN